MKKLIAVALFALTVVSFALTNSAFANQMVAEYSFDAATCFEKSSGRTLKERLKQCGLEAVVDNPNDPNEYSVWMKFPESSLIQVEDSPQAWAIDKEGKTYQQTFFIKNGKVWIYVGDIDGSDIDLNINLTYLLTFESQKREENSYRPKVTVEGILF